MHARALSGWLAALAPELQALQAQVPGFAFDDPARLADLHADLRDADPQHNGAAAASTATRTLLDEAWLTVPASQRAAFRWGLAYVVEGSQLGGQVLHRRLAKRLAPHPLRYLQGRGGDQSGARWRDFIGRLHTEVRSADAISAACAAAGAAFDGLTSDLRAAGVPL